MPYNIVYKDEIQHHGILGQKWGVRRYQNEDGSLTNQGRQRYGENGQPVERRTGGDYKSPEEKKANREKAIKTGLAVAGTALAVAGTAYLATKGVQKLKDTGNKLVKEKLYPKWKARDAKLIQKGWIITCDLADKNGDGMGKIHVYGPNDTFAKQRYRNGGIIPPPWLRDVPQGDLYKPEPKPRTLDYYKWPPEADKKPVDLGKIAKTGLAVGGAAGAAYVGVKGYKKGKEVVEQGKKKWNDAMNKVSSKAKKLKR